MRDLFKPLKKTGLGAALGLLVALTAVDGAKAANPLELNFWLSGPRYDGRVGECERALPTITSQFQEKESSFWNSPLVIQAYGRIRVPALAVGQHSAPLLLRRRHAERRQDAPGALLHH